MSWILSCWIVSAATLISLALPAQGEGAEPTAKKSAVEKSAVEKAAARRLAAVSLRNDAAEPKAKQFSLDQALVFMDSATTRWQERQRCVTCHTNGLYLVARAQVGKATDGLIEARSFARSYLKKYLGGGKPATGRRGAVEGMVATASFLAISEVLSGGELHRVTKAAFDHVWELQDEEGAWTDWLKCGWPPYECDDHFGASLVALALGYLPRSYRETEPARKGERRLRQYLRKHPPLNLHQKGMLLWASVRLDGIVMAVERERWIKDLLGRRRSDGGWRLVDLGKGKWKRAGDAVKDLRSDAYATAFSVFILQQAGVPADHPAFRDGLKWLRREQRVSGRWFVRSPRKDGRHFISHAASQFAVMALTGLGKLGVQPARNKESDR